MMPMVAGVLGQQLGGGGVVEFFDHYSMLNEFWAEDPSWSDPGDGNTVASWRDNGTRATDATQSTEADKPVYRSAATNLNSKPAIDFVSSDLLQTSTSTATSGTYSVGVVWAADSVSGTRYAVDGTGVNNRNSIGHTSGPVFRNFFGVTVDDSSTAPSANTAYCSISVVDDGTQSHRLNGAVDYTGTVNVDDNRGLSFGGSHSSSNHIDGQIGYAFVYSGDITAASGFADWEQAILDHYGIS